MPAGVVNSIHARIDEQTLLYALFLFRKSF